ncbi:MAG: hypothetical protein KC456_13890 [Flavobacteriales bacterium]|nr:hypothetical protein [Flavobacteriales bacterium]
MHGYTKIAIERIVFALLLALIVLMTLVRAYLIPPTQDEVISFFEYAISDSSWMLDTRTSNNHLLNTILGKACTLLFGLNMFAFRLTNVLALILYGLGVWRIGSRLKFEMKWLLMINLLFAYPIIEYFGLARGYGISFAFLLLQLSYLLEYVTQRKLKDLYLSVLCLGLAVFANLGLTVHLVVSLGVMVLSNMLPMQRPKYWFPVVCSGVFVVIFGTIGSGLNRNNELYFGQSAGFYNTTVDSLLNMFEYSTDSVLTVLFLGSLLVLVALSVLSDLPPRRTEFTSSPKSILCLVFALNVLGTICLAEAFDINYPSERVGLYFVILFLLHSAFAINEVRWKSLRIGILSANIVLTIGILTHTTMAFSLEKSGVDPFAHLSANSFKRIAAASEVEEILPIVSGDERLSFAYRYYSFYKWGWK